MPNQKTSTPNSILDVKQYIFCDSDDGLVLSDSRFLKLFKSCRELFKPFNLSFKKDVPYFKLSVARCPYCGTRHVVKYGFTSRTLVFKEIGKTKVKVQRYICKRCGKTFQTDLTSLVDKNSNFTNELKSESEHLISDYLGSLKNVCKSFKKFFGISVSHQTIENWLFVNENILEFDLGRCSGYYVFDVEWLKINGKWKYRHTLLDAISNCIVADAIYYTEDETTVQKFLKESTANKNKKAITTDLDSKYPQIITKLGFKHQLCIFHAKKSLNKQLKVFKDKFHLSDEEYEECHQQLKIIKNLFDLNDYDEAEKELQSLIFRKNEFHPAIYEIIRKSISPRYKSFIYHLKDKRIEKTSNKIENAFQKTMPKSRKRIFKTTRGVLKRIYRRDLIWNDNRKMDLENQQSF
jgi:transposase-like protein